MEINKLKKDKGVAGLNMLLAVVTFLFITGFLVMIFALMGGELYGADDVLKTGVAGSVTQSNVNFSEINFTPTGLGGLRSVAYVTTEFNLSVNGTQLDSSNYTLTAQQISGSPSEFNNSLVNLTANYTHTTDTTQSAVINTTTSSLADTTDWFGIIIVISAMVVLILLTVVIINSIRGSGLLASA